ncbi:nephrin [Catharus ustulatus]|uniref:nephrin n=1 Tax=Catharus ustulatus TaxID=91951 RepID=UPI00140A0ABF|nr:nephrin [Catharus ustulatus]
MASGDNDNGATTPLGDVIGVTAPGDDGLGSGIDLGAVLALVVIGGNGSPFLEEPANQSVALGEGAELRCRARVGVAVQWAREGLLLGAPPTRAHPRYRLAGDPLKVGVSPRVGVSPGEHHLRIRPVTLEDDAEFQCQAGEGNGTRASRPALLTLELLEGAELPLRGGAELQVRCRARDGRPSPHLELRLGQRLLPDVSWRELEGSHPKLRDGEVTARLTPGPADQGLSLVCSASNAAGAAPAPARLRLDIAGDIRGLPPLVRAGEELELICESRGGRPAPSLHWDKDGRPLVGAWSEHEGGVARTRLVLSPAPEDDGTTLRCSAVTSLPEGGASTSVKLRVTGSYWFILVYTGSYWSDGPSELTLLGSGAVPEDGEAQLSCTSAPSNPPVRLRWWLGGRELQATHQGVVMGGGAVSNLTLRGRVQDHGAPLVCEAETPGVGTKSVTVTVSVSHAPLVSAPSPVVVPEGSEAVLELSVRAHPPPESCQWSVRGRGISPEGSPRFRLSPGGALVIANVTRGDSAPYRAWCHNAEGGAGTDVTLLVQVPPSIVRAPDPVVVAEGGEGRLLCEAEGSPLPPGSVRWGRLGDSGSPLSLPPELGGSPLGDSGSPLALPPELQPLPGGPGGSLRVSGARRHLGGPYECRVESGVPPPARAIVRLVVTYAPEMEAEPQEGAGLGAGPGAVLVPEGAESATLRCRAQGVPGVELSWESNGRGLRLGEPGSPFQERQWREGPWTSSVLSVTNVTRARARLRRLFLQSHQSSQSSQSPRPRYRYRNQPTAPPDWEHWEHWEGGNGTIGVFVCVARNERGSVRRRLQLRLADRPDPPRALRLSGVSGTSLSLEWDPGFDGGLPQHFLLRAEGPDAPPPPAALVTSGFALTLGGLRPDTPYDVTVRARNARGDSAPARLRAVTSAQLRRPPQLRLGLLGAPQGGGASPVRGGGAVGGLRGGAPGAARDPPGGAGLRGEGPRAEPRPQINHAQTSSNQFCPSPSQFVQISSQFLPSLLQILFQSPPILPSLF